MTSALEWTELDPALMLFQSYRAQGGANGPASRSEDGTCNEYLNVLEDTL
jgi:hypothetical protein